MVNDDNESKGALKEVENILEEGKELAKNITVANFVRYVGPGIVLFGLMKVSKIPFFKTFVTTSEIDKKDDSTFLLLLFLVVGVLVHTVYRAFFYNKFIVSLKGCKKLNGRDWNNYREVLRMKNEELRKRNKGLRNIIKCSYDSDWVWRQLKLRFFTHGYNKYDPGMALWSASIHLLYFTGISTFILVIPEGYYGGYKWGFFYLAIGIVTFLGGLLADTEYERFETSLYEEHLDKKKVDDFLGKLFKNQSFRVQGNSSNNGRGNEEVG